MPGSLPIIHIVRLSLGRLDLDAYSGVDDRYIYRLQRLDLERSDACGFHRYRLLVIVIGRHRRHGVSSRKSVTSEADKR